MQVGVVESRSRELEFLVSWMSEESLRLLQQYSHDGGGTRMGAKLNGIIQSVLANFFFP